MGCCRPCDYPCLCQGTMGLKSMATASLTRLWIKKFKRRHMEAEYTINQGNVFGGEGASLKQWLKDRGHSHHIVFDLMRTSPEVNGTFPQYTLPGVPEPTTARHSTSFPAQMCSQQGPGPHHRDDVTSPGNLTQKHCILRLNCMKWKGLIILKGI